MPLACILRRVPQVIVRYDNSYPRAGAPGLELLLTFVLRQK